MAINSGGALDVAGSPFKCHIGSLMWLNGTGTLKNSLDLKILGYSTIQCDLHNFPFSNRWMPLLGHVMLLEALMLPPLQ